MLFPNRRDELIDALLQSPQAKAAVDARAKEIAKKRVDLAKQRNELEGKAEAAYHEHEKLLSAALTSLQAADKAVAEARERVSRITAERVSSSIKCAAAMERIEVSLWETADPAIALFIREMEGEWQACRRKPAVDNGQLLINANTGKREYRPGPALMTPADRMRAIREVIAAAHGLKLEADQGAIAARLESLRALIPEIGTPRG